MKRKRFFVLLAITAIMASSFASLAGSATGSYKTVNGNVNIETSVSFVEGPLTLQDKYWGYASISGQDVDAASVRVKGWTKNETLINTTLNYMNTSVSVSGKKCGYGQTWGKLSVTYDGITKTITATD